MFQEELFKADCADLGRISLAPGNPHFRDDQKGVTSNNSFKGKRQSFLVLAQ
jgi:hypothetical protein